MAQEFGARPHKEMGFQCAGRDVVVQFDSVTMGKKPIKIPLKYFSIFQLQKPDEKAEESGFLGHWFKQGNSQIRSDNLQRNSWKSCPGSNIKKP